MFVILTLQGLLQGLSLMRGTEWHDSVGAIRPYWQLRTLTGIAMDVGISLLVINLMKTSLTRRAA
jgi:cytochrome c oxidase cbb3-type subunit 1